MSWPTSEQFDAAHAAGAEYALLEAGEGATQAQESPLSGEWADGMTPRKIAYNVGFIPTHANPVESQDYQDGEQELADAWERGYFDAWTHSIGAD